MKPYIGLAVQARINTVAGTRIAAAIVTEVVTPDVDVTADQHAVVDLSCFPHDASMSLARGVQLHAADPGDGVVNRAWLLPA
jgi:hypothetical protein